MIYGDSLAEGTGKQHDYLGMIFNFSSKNEVQINMNLYSSKIIKEFPEEIIGKLATPAGDHLFKIRKMDANLMMRWQAPFITLYINCPSQQIVRIEIFKRQYLFLLLGYNHRMKMIRKN